MSVVLIKTLSSSENNFKSQLKSILHVDSASNDEIIKVVNAIVDEVKNNGDKALLEFTNKLDGVNVKSVKELEITQYELDDSLNKILPSQKIALEKAAFRVADYHRRQITNSWDYRDEKGSLFGQKVTPIDRVGLYVPGGKAAYPSSVIMNAVPAKVAGVKELIMVVPTPKGDKNQLVLAAAKLSGVNRVFAIGGAQAVAALAFGTETIPQVDKIVGPGNAYVAEAKRKVFGTVGIDMIAGPSEILVICDGKTNPDWIAMDLFSQAEHDELAQSILICPDKNFINLVKKSMDKLIDQMMRKKIIKTSLEARGLFILVKDLAEAVEISNMIAP